MAHERHWWTTRTGRAGLAAVAAIPILASVLAGLALDAKRAGHGKPAGEEPLTPLFLKTTPAENATVLTLAVDDSKVLGWVSGAESYAGREVVVRAGEAAQTITVQRDNTFTWHYAVDKDTPVTFTVGKLHRQARVTAPAKLSPTAFFVVDRTVYRPGQKLQFAGFLRTAGRGGRFEPLPGKEVKVALRSKSKKTTAGELALTSDGFGRIEGEYRFMPGDALDDYTLSIAGYLGQAEVKLAEFRKAKVRLHITGAREEGKLRLRFEARDFLNKPVPAQRVQFTAKVFHRPAAKKTRDLDAKAFVYRNETDGWLPDPDELTEEQLYLWAHQGRWPTPGAATMVAQVAGKIELTGEPAGEHDLTLQEPWLGGNCVVQVEAVLVDENQREQRAIKTIPLEAIGKPQGARLVVKTPKRVFCAGETVRVAVQLAGADGGTTAPPANTSLVVLRTTNESAGAHYPPQPLYLMNSMQAYPAWQYGNGWNGRPGGPDGRFWRGRYLGQATPQSWVPVQPIHHSAGEMVTASAVEGGKVQITFDQPGTYDLVAVARLDDGKTLRQKTACTVLPADERTLALVVDKSEYQAGQVLQGQVHSRLSGAKVLLTLRDSRGIRLWRTITVDGSAVRFRQTLPGELNYGCSLVVQHVGKDGQIHTAHKNIRVTPTDRMLEIQTTVPPVTEPGKEVTLDIQVNRNRPVDLVVSVYDQSLLGIAPDQSVDVRSFYLADERAFGQAARDALRRSLGDVTLEELVQQAQKILTDQPKSPQANLARQVVRACANSHINLNTLDPLLRFAGVRARCLYYYGGWNYRLNKAKGATNRLADVLDAEYNEWRLAGYSYNDLLILCEAHPSHRGRPYYAGGYNGGGGYAQDARARGDSMYSLSANGMFSVSGQSFISHLPPAAGPAPVLMPDTNMGDVAVRRDFSDSAFWNAAVRTDSAGRARVTFKLPDSLTNWRVVATGITGDMHVGHKTASFRTYKPIMVWPMIPRVFNEGDKVRVFARVHNRTDDDKTIRVKLKVENGKVLGREVASVRVGPNDSAAVYWTFQPGQAGYTQLLMTADCPAGSDASLKRLPVMPACSVEQVTTVSGFCTDPAKFTVPKELDLKTARLEITLVPSLAADMIDTLDYLVQYPHGCAEQTMSRFIPAVRVAGICKQIGVPSQKLQEKLPEYVAVGIKKLINYQKPDGGWGWNGNGGTHEMMTPYVLYGLLEAERAGYTLPNATAIERGLTRLRQFIDAMSEKQAADRIYCLYVYTLRKPMEEKWWQFIAARDDAGKLSDYATALALEMAVRLKKPALAGSLAQKLRRRAVVSAGEVTWTTAGFSKWGDDPHEITAAVLKALVAVDPDDKLIPGILSYFASTKRGKRWNSTKDTAMILLAMCDYLARKNVKIGKDSSVRLALNDGPQRTVNMADGLMQKVVIPGEELRREENLVRFTRGASGAMYRLVFRYRKREQDVAPFGAGVRVTRTFGLLDKTGKQIREIKPDETIPRGSYIASTVSIQRHGNGQMNYLLVESPKPSSCEIVPVTDKRFNHSSTQYVLREDKTHAVLYHHQQTGATVVDRAVFYAELAGEFVVPPAYVELMYQTTVRGHSGTFRFKVSDDKDAKEVVSAD